MFDIGAMELLVIVIVAVLVIGPKDMPLAMRSAGRWIGKVRKVSAHFRTGIDAMVREAELEDMEKKWKARNEEIMREHPPTTQTSSGAQASAEAAGSSLVATDTGAEPHEGALAGGSADPGAAPSDPDTPEKA